MKGDREERPPRKQRINLALQGGGAHGAFTWGVLDRLLEDGRLEVAGICGTSAGAMNGAALAYGLARDGREGARRVLSAVWEELARRAAWGPLRPTPLDRLLSRGDMAFSPGWVMLDALSRMVSPYVTNPLNRNPLVEVLEGAVDFAWLRDNGTVPLFVCATNVLTGRLRVFSREEVTAKAVMASACLPLTFQAVEVDGEHYWDGGFMGNPPLFPLIYETDCEDVLIVQVNPVNIEKVPVTAQEIMDRMNELSFNSSLMRELRAVAFVQKLLAENRIPRGRYKGLRVHAVGAEREMAALGYSSKMNADAAFLDWLFELGRDKAGAFLDEHLDKVGRESSVDIAATYL